MASEHKDSCILSIWRANELFGRCTWLLLSVYGTINTILQVQRQLQLRIEAQGKYLKKIVEEQQRLTGVLSEAPLPGTGDTCHRSHDKADPPKSLFVDESFSSQHDPQTPDSVTPNERPEKKHRAEAEMGLTTRSILESGLSPSYEPHSIFMPREHFDHSSIGGENQLERVCNSDP